MRTADGSITNSRNPWKLPAPALPASTSVVAPERRATGSGRTLSEVPPQYTWVCRSISPGATSASAAATVALARAGSIPGATSATLPPANATS